MSSDSFISPGFSDWNSVFIKYCDGSSFTSARATATAFNSTTLHHNGALMYRPSPPHPSVCSKQPSRAAARRLSAAVRDIYRFGLAHATDVVVAGCSAGGLAVLLNIDRIRSLLPADARVRGLSDAGYFIETSHRLGSGFLCGFRFLHQECVNVN